MFLYLVIFPLLYNYGESSTNDVHKRFKTRIYWNIPTFQCDSHKLNFSNLAEKYNIVQNENDRFRGNEIVILYDPGDFPAILRGDSKSYLRNGGIPQQGNLTLHLNLFKSSINDLVPDKEFSGIGVIDFESWRPIYRQNFGILAPYRTLSLDLEKKIYPFWPSAMLEKEAQKKFEFYARQFMEETIHVARKMRPNATWGYYAYPYCFNMSPNNMRRDCPTEVTKENDAIEWLFKQSNNLHPSLYLSGMRLSKKQNTLMVEGRIAEAHRIAGYVRKFNKFVKIIPYFWYKYNDDVNNFVSKENLFEVFVALAAAHIDGLIIWGSSNDVNTKNKCLQLYNFIDKTLGPALINNF